MINVVVIDDEKLAVENLIFFLKKFDCINVVDGFTEVGPLLECLNKVDIQLVFTDIEMPEMNGLELASYIIEKHPNIEVVFATAYNQYAVQAFELNAIDYILKPIGSNRLASTIEKIQKRIPDKKERSVEIRTLGGFEILIDGKPIPFKLAKAKEVLAFLVHNQGKSMGWMPIADEVWPDSIDDKKLMNNFHVACFSLRTFLADNQISEIFDYGRNTYKVNVDKFKCDLYELIDTYQVYQKTKKVNIFTDVYDMGDYLENLNYSWCYGMQDKVRKMVRELQKAWANQEK